MIGATLWLALLIIVLHGNISSEGFLFIPPLKSNDVLLLTSRCSRATSTARRVAVPAQLQQYVESSSSTATTSRKGTQKTSLYNYYNESDEVYDVSDCTIRSFNMDLYNLAMEDPFAAEDAVNYLVEQREQQQDKLVPNSASFGIVMEGFIQNNELEGAEAFLFREEPAGGATTGVTLHECMRLMQAWKDYEITSDFRGHGAEQAERILRRYRGPEEEKLLCVAIEAWSRRSGLCVFAIDRAEQLLLELEDRPKNGNRTETSRLYAYTSYMVGLSKMRSRPDVATTAQNIYETKITQPDVVAVTAVLNCWAKTRSTKERSIAATQAIAILDDLERREYLEANVVTYRTAIAAIGNSLQDADLALAESIITDRMPGKGIEPDTKTYNMLLLYAVRDAQRAVEILETMPCEPDVETWGAVLRLCDPDQGQLLLNKMERLYEKDPSNVRPNCVCYTTVRPFWQ
jgi:Pentatricopeptide repeat domain